jgi:membrane protein implicated in regulation of membrane protease activity
MAFFIEYYDVIFWVGYAALLLFYVTTFVISWRKTPTLEQSPREHVRRRLYQTFVMVMFGMVGAFVIWCQVVPDSLVKLLGFPVYVAAMIFTIRRYARAVRATDKLSLDG